METFQYLFYISYIKNLLRIQKYIILMIYNINKIEINSIINKLSKK